LKKVLFSILFFLISAKICFAGVSIIGDLSSEKIVKPGEKSEGTILLKNTGENPHEVRVYQTDYLFFADGRNIYGEPGSIPRSNAKWLFLSPTRFTIPPNRTASVHYNIQVPENPELKGTYWSMVMVEPMAEAIQESKEGEKAKVRLGLQTIIRYGIQIVNDIGDTGIRKIRFLDKKLISEDGKKIFQIDIENIGERWLSPLVWIELYNEQGQSIGRFESVKFRIYPGCSVRHRVELTNVPKGKYKVLVVADNGDESIFGARYDLGIE
jgi:archaellum component FlaG (FlaF/FlaG flagellin family)